MEGREPAHQAHHEPLVLVEPRLQFVDLARDIVFHLSLRSWCGNRNGKRRGSGLPDPDPHLLVDGAHMSAPFHLVAFEPSEHDLQIACTKMLFSILLPEVCWTAIDHAHSLDRRLSKRGFPIGLIEMQKRKARGIRSGLWDYFFWHRSVTHVIELKVGDGNLSPSQEDFGRQLIRAGVTQLKVCWSKDQLFNTVVEWGLTRNAVMT